MVDSWGFSVRKSPLANCIILIEPLFQKEKIFGLEMNSTKYWMKLSLQSWTKYLRQTRVFLWNRALREESNFYLPEFFASIDKIFILGAGLRTRIIPWSFGIFLIFPNFLKSLNLKYLKSFDKSWGNLNIPCLLLIITLCFTCGETCGETLV